MPRSYNEHNERYSNPFGLTNVQVETIQAIADGCGFKQAAHILHVQEPTIRERMYMIRAKMGADTTLQAAVRWVREVEFANAVIFDSPQTWVTNPN